MPLPSKNNSEKQRKIKKTVSETEDILSNFKDLAEDRSEETKKNINDEDEESKKQNKHK